MPEEHPRDIIEIYYVSDRTARTAELAGESLLAQFPGLSCRVRRFPFMDRAEKLKPLAARLRARIRRGGAAPLVFSTLVRPDLRRILKESGAPVFDLYEHFLPGLQDALERAPAPRIGVPHEDFESREESEYQRRTMALEFTLAHDDGLKPERYDRADVIVLGVSRSAKTPVCLYLAMHFFQRAANYPLTGEELEAEHLPDFLRRHRRKLVGLTIDPRRLHEIREKRRPGSRYAALETCRYEVRRAMELFRMEDLPVFDSSSTSIEEISVAIVRRLKLFSRP